MQLSSLKTNVGSDGTVEQRRLVKHSDSGSILVQIDELGLCQKCPLSLYLIIQAAVVGKTVFK